MGDDEQDSASMHSPALWMECSGPAGTSRCEDICNEDRSGQLLGLLGGRCGARVKQVCDGRGTGLA